MQKFLIIQRDCFNKMQAQTEVWGKTAHDALQNWKDMNRWYKHGEPGMPRISVVTI